MTDSSMFSIREGSENKKTAYAQNENKEGDAA